MFKRTLVAMVALVVSLSLSLLTGSTPVQAQNNGASLTPPMGWSSWSSIRNNPTEAKIKAQAQAMHDSGLMSAGYQYINLDDYYIMNPGTTVDQYGRWVVDTGKFPDGMKNLGDFVHGLGEKFGMYVTPGIPKAAYDQNTPIEGTSNHARDIVSSTTTFESNYGGWGNVMYFIDYNKNPTAAQAFVNSWAKLFASYGADYIKIDGVHTSDQDDVIAWSKALNQTGRTPSTSACRTPWTSTTSRPGSSTPTAGGRPVTSSATARPSPPGATSGRVGRAWPSGDRTPARVAGTTRTRSRSATVTTTV